MIQLLSLSPLHCNNTAVSHIFYALGSAQQGDELRTQMLVPSCSAGCRGDSLQEAIPKVLQRFYYRIPSASQWQLERQFLKQFQAYDAVSLWPGVSLAVTKRVKASGKPIFLERINCFQGEAKPLLDRLYEELGYPAQHPITTASIDHELSEIELADYLVCPSPEVARSFLDIGFPAQKLIASSFGWDPHRFKHGQREPAATQPLTVLFVGSVCVRKGAHVLLRAWEKANIKGRLMLCGAMETAIAQSCQRILNRPDVEHVPYTSDLSTFYTQGDLFAFPSFEEGSPLVTYEAMANGLPILTSPMGAGGIVRPEKDGWILSPYEEDTWVEALRQIANAPELRLRYGDSSRQRSQEFTWSKVAARRSAQMIDKLRTI
jgi:glycosyltransferase involved in cell wall biosynthesis